MVKRLKTYAASIMIVLALCGILTPAVCQPAHSANNSASMSYMSDCDIALKKTDTGNDIKQSKDASSHTCVCHHCSTAKLLVFPAQLSSRVIQEASALLSSLVNEVIPSSNSNNLDRPPKNLA